MGKFPSGWELAKCVDIWQVGHIFVWSPVFKNWIQKGIMLSIRPNEYGYSAYHREKGVSMHHHTKVMTRIEN